MEIAPWIHPVRIMHIAGKKNVAVPWGLLETDVNSKLLNVPAIPVKMVVSAWRKVLMAIGASAAQVT